MTDQAYLQAKYKYNPETGELIHRRLNRVVGFKNGKYLYVEADGESYPIHRVIWMYCYGSWPIYHIDHIDRDPLNNRIANLRDVPVVVNIANRDVSNDTGYKGVVAGTRSGGVVKYCARIRISGVMRILGWFATAKEAHEVFRAAHLEQYGEHSEYWAIAA